MSDDDTPTLPAIATRLTRFGVVEVDGDDATEFLQNQLTNDVHLATPEQGQLQAWLNPKGRALTTFWLLVPEPGRYWLIMPRERIAATMKRLTMFVLRSRVTLADHSEAFALFGLRGAEPLQRATALLGRLPKPDWGCVTAGPHTAIALPQPAGLLLLSPQHHSAATATTLAIGGDSDEQGWWLGLVRAGLPVVTEATSEAFVPQMLNWERIGGVSFKKGCYPGQEVVARMHYLGKPKRRTFRLASGGPCPAEGSTVTLADDTGNAAGQVVNAAPTPEGGCELLAVLKLDARGSGAALADSDGRPLQPQALPYALDDPEGD